MEIQYNLDSLSYGEKLLALGASPYSYAVISAYLQSNYYSCLTPEENISEATSAIVFDMAQLGLIHSTYMLGDYPNPDGLEEWTWGDDWK